MSIRAYVQDRPEIATVSGFTNRSILSARCCKDSVFFQIDDCGFFDADPDDVEDLALISKLRI
jgi:hypothetical protein